MAKKKKIDNVRSARSLTAGNFMDVQGNVTVTFVRNGKEVKKINQHNTANLPLCTYIRNALYGDYVIASKPGKIRICDKSGSTIVPKVNTPFFPLSSVDREKRDDGVSLYFKLPYDSVQGVKIYGLMLYAENATVEDESKYYASIAFEEPLEAVANTNMRIE